MRFYRLYEDLPGRHPLGYGTAPGRWNRKGVPMIYAASTAALAFLELLSIRGSVVLQSRWMLATLRCKREVPMLDVGALPDSWNAIPHPPATWAFGDVWVQEAGMPALRIPSARLPLELYPHECNVIINPLQGAYAEALEVEEVREVGFLLNA